MDPRVRSKKLKPGHETDQGVGHQKGYVTIQVTKHDTIQTTKQATKQVNKQVIQLVTKQALKQQHDG